MVTREVLDAELRAFKPRATSPFVTLRTIEAFSVTQSANDPIDRGSVTIENTDDKLSGANRITSGDRVEIDVRLRGEKSLSRRFTAIARDITDSLEGGDRRTVEIELTGFALSVCSFRNVDGAFKGVDVGSVVDSLVAADAPEVDRSRIQTVGRTIDINIQGRRLFDIITQELQPAGDAVVAGDKRSLVFRNLGDISVKHGLTDVDVHAPISVERVDDELRNRVRIDGGIDTAVDDEQLTQSATTRVTDSDRFTQAIKTRKSEVDKVQVFTVRDSNSSDNLTVRLQAGRNGSPVDVKGSMSNGVRPTFKFWRDQHRVLRENSGAYLLVWYRAEGTEIAIENSRSLRASDIEISNWTYPGDSHHRSHSLEAQIPADKLR